MGATTNWAIAYADNASTSGYQPNGSTMASSVETQLNRSALWIAANQTQENTAAASGTEGTLLYRTDTDTYKRHNGTSFVRLIDSLTSSLPTSSSGTIDTATGTVTFTAASSVSLDGIFTSSDRRHNVQWSFTLSGAASINLQLRASGSTNSTSNYDRQVIQGVNATAAAAQSLASTSWALAGLAGTFEGSFAISNAANSAYATTGIIDHGATPNPMTTSAGIYRTLAQHRSLAAFDGLLFTPTTGTMTGWIRVTNV